MIVLQTSDPLSQGARVMVAEILHVAHLEARPFRRRQHDRNRRDVAVRKNMFIDERRAAFTARADPFPDRMVEEDTAGFQESAELFEISLQMGAAHVFRHADAHDRIERLRLR